MSTRSELFGVFPLAGPLPYLNASVPRLRQLASSGPYPEVKTWFHATYSGRLNIILRTGLIPSCWWGGDTCGVFGFDRLDELCSARRDDWVLEVRSCALPVDVKAWWVPRSAIRGFWRKGQRQIPPPLIRDVTPLWPREPAGCGCELHELVREQQEIWRRTWG